MEYSDAEKKLFTGNKINFGADAPRVRISAQSLRDAILAADLETHETRHRDSSYSISGAEISGILDLSDLYPTREDALISLHFVDCTFQDTISIARSAITSIRFERCALKMIDGERVFVHGSVELHQVTSSEPADSRTGQEAADNWFGRRGAEKPASQQRDNPEDGQAVKVSKPQGLCQIHLRHSEIGHSVIIKESVLVGPKLRGDIDLKNEILQFALNLSSAQVKGSVHLIEGTAALGGVSLGAAQIQGDVYMAGARLVSGEGPAFNGQLLCVSGFVALRSKTLQDGRVARFESVGLIKFLNARIGGGIDLSAGLFEAGPSNPIAIDMGNCDSIGSVHATSLITSEHSARTTVVGCLRMIRCEIRGDIWLSDLEISHKQSPPSEAIASTEAHSRTPVLTLITSTVNGRLLLSGGFRGGIDLSDTRVVRSVYLGDAPQHLEFVCSPEDVRLINMNGVQIESTLEVSSLKVEALTGVDRLKNNLVASHDLEMRSYPLPFAPGTQFHELQIKGRKRKFCVGILETEEQFTILDGSGVSIISGLSKSNLDFGSHDNIKEYLRLFCHNIYGDLGPFMIIERGDWLYSILPDKAKQVVEDIEILPATSAEVGNPDEYYCIAKVSIWYGPALFRSTLALRKNLVVDMTEDESRYEGLLPQIAQLKPLKYLAETAKVYDDQWQFCPTLLTTPTHGVLDKGRRRSLLAASKTLTEGYRTRPVINLQNVHVRELSDDDGKAWPDGVRLILAGFTYDALRITDSGDDIREERGKAPRMANMENRWRKRAKVLGRSLRKFFVLSAIATVLIWCLLSYRDAFIIIIPVAGLWLGLRIRNKTQKGSAPRGSAPWRARKRWLSLQYEDLRPSRQEFIPQPFEQLAAVFRKQGQEEDFRRISRLKLAWKDKVDTALIWRPFTALYRIGFGYGFSTFRAFTTFSLLLLFGIWATEKALEKQLLVLSASPDVYVVAATTAAPGQPSNRSRLDVPCRGEINSPIYALDTLLPLIDLGQETRCSIRTEMELSSATSSVAAISAPPSLASYQDFSAEALRRMADYAFRPTAWQYGLAVYKLLGWIVLSLLIFTISNSMRRASGG